MKLEIHHYPAGNGFGVYYLVNTDDPTKRPIQSAHYGPEDHDDKIDQLRAYTTGYSDGIQAARHLIPSPYFSGHIRDFPIKET